MLPDFLISQFFGNPTTCMTNESTLIVLIPGDTFNQYITST